MKYIKGCDVWHPFRLEGVTFDAGHSRLGDAYRTDWKVKVYNP